MDSPTLPAEPTQQEEQELQWYTKLERCDSCGAQAFYRVEFSTGFLFLCYHHYNRHETKMFETALDVVDESELLKP